MPNIFLENAPKYWEHNLPAMPLKTNTKVPLLQKWQSYGIQMPSETERSEWLMKFPHNNLGLPLGVASGITIIDIDTERQEIIDAIMLVLPPSPWCRIGRKGMALAYKFRQERATKIVSKEEGMVVEILSQGNQMVLPPSIHPETLQPYVASCNLYDVLDQLNYLPADIEAKLRACLVPFVTIQDNAKSGFKLAEHVPLGARDVSMTRMVGLTCSQVMHGEISVKRGLANIQAWVDINVAKSDDGDNLDIRKALQKFIDFLLVDINRNNKILPPGWDDELTPDDIINYGLDVITEDNQELNYAQLLERIHMGFQEIPENDRHGRMLVVDSIIKKVSKCARLNTLEVKELLSVIKNHSGLNTTVSDMKKELERLKRGPIEGTDHRELAVGAVELYLERVSELRYHDESFWNWNGTNWQKLEDEVLLELISSNFGKLQAGKRANDTKGILTTIKHLEKIKKPLSPLEVEGVNFLNGFLTPDLKLIPHHPDHGKTYVLNFCYKPEQAGNCPKFFNHLFDCWGEEPDYAERLVTLQEAIATTLFGISSQFQKVFLFYGQAGSGKSVIMECIQHIVPEEAQSAVPPDKWSDTFYYGMLKNTLLNIAGELSNTSKIDGAIFKRTIEGAKVVLNGKYSSIETDRVKAAQWFAGNCYPSTTDTSAGFSRRWIIWDFKKTVPKHKKIANLGKIIAREEVEGIIAWAIKALPALLVRGDYSVCPSSEYQVELMAMKNSPIREWFSETLIRAENKKLYLKDLYNLIHSYSAQRAERAPKQLTFFTELQQIIQETGSYVVENDEKGDYLIGFGLKKR